MESFRFFLDLFLPIDKFFNNFFFENRFFYYFLNNDGIFITVHYFLNNCFNWFLHYIGHFDLFDSFNKYRLLWLLKLQFKIFHFLNELLFVDSLFKSYFKNLCKLLHNFLIFSVSQVHWLFKFISYLWLAWTSTCIVDANITTVDLKGLTRLF